MRSEVRWLNAGTVVVMMMVAGRLGRGDLKHKRRGTKENNTGEK